MAPKVKVKKTAKKKTAAKTAPVRKRIAKKPLVVKVEELHKSPNEDWAGLFVLTEHWKSDLKFYADESRFLRNLIDKYFMWLIDEKYINATGKMATRLMEFEHRRTQLENNVGDHLMHLVNLIRNPFACDAPGYRDEHAGLEDSMVTLVKDFRTIKKEIFLLTEQVIESEKVKHLLER